MGDLALGLERAGVLFLGSLIPRKEPGALVEAAARLPRLELTLVGEGGLADRLRAQIDGLGLSGRVRLAPPPPDLDGHLPWVRRRLLGAEALCLPSHSEGLPLAFVEALACGTPIIGFGPAVREIREELGIDVGEPLDDGDPATIAAAIEKVTAASWDREELRRAALAHFGLGRIADRYVALLTRAAEGAAEPGGADPAATRSSAAAERDSTVICVLGMSRSGTSLTARVLDLAGVYLGPEEELLGAEPRQLAAEGEGVLAKARGSNPSGHWEHYRLMRLNERILQLHGGSWREPPPLPPGWQASARLDDLRDEAREILAESFAGRRLWGWKDPRNSLTLPFWQELLPSMRCVICVRNPLDVAASLRRRDGVAVADGVELWVRYLAAALACTSGRPRLLVPYESYFADPVGTVTRLSRFAGCDRAPAGPASTEALIEAIDERLWRNRASSAAANGSGAVSPEAASLFRVAELLARVDDGATDASGLNAAADVYAEGLAGRP